MTVDTRKTIGIVIVTALGEIELELRPDAAPITVANFLQYADAGAYDGGIFHRAVKPDNQPNNEVKIDVVQGGLNPERKRGGSSIPLERTSVTGLRHVDSAISIGRMAPNSADSEFFICIGDQPELDFGGRRNPDGQGFAAFGRVTRGMDVVRTIQRQPEEEQRITPPVLINRITRLDWKENPPGVGVRGLEPPTSASQTPRATNCATPRYRIASIVTGQKRRQLDDAFAAGSTR